MPEQSFLWLNGLGSPFGIETMMLRDIPIEFLRLNGLGSPFGIETSWRPMRYTWEEGG